MDVSITQFRREMFALVGHAMHGEPVCVTHKGSRFRIVPEEQVGDRFSRVTPLQVVNPEVGEQAEAAVKEEMVRAWERDWSDLH